MKGFEHQRHEMVVHQLKGQGVRDARVLEAMSVVPRHAFLPPDHWDVAYLPQAVHIGEGQTISQPYMVAIMTEALQISGGERVLEIGTGSGYQAAILAEMGAEVVTIERVESLAVQARRQLDALGYGAVRVLVGDGSSDDDAIEGGFDRILVTAAAPGVPDALLARLRDPGRLVCPVGDRDLQVLEILDRQDGQDTVRHGCACRFVPLLGGGGFTPA